MDAHGWAHWNVRDGNLLQRTGIGERVVLEETVQLLEGRTLSSRVGYWPVLIIGLASLIFGAATQRRLSQEVSHV